MGNFDRLQQVIVMVVSILVLALVVRREFRDNREPDFTTQGVQRVLSDGDWDELRSLSRPLRETARPDRARATLVMVVDMQCPGCGHFHLNVLPELERDFGDQLDIRVLHFPIPTHAAALDAAIAAECVADEGAVGWFLDAAFHHPSLVAEKAWTQLVDSARATIALDAAGCWTSRASIRVDSMRSLGHRIGVLETPTLVLDGVINPASLNVPSLRAAIKRAMSATSD